MFFSFNEFPSVSSKLRPQNGGYDGSNRVLIRKHGHDLNFEARSKDQVLFSSAAPVSKNAVSPGRRKASATHTHTHSHETSTLPSFYTSPSTFPNTTLSRVYGLNSS